MVLRSDTIQASTNSSSNSSSGTDPKTSNQVKKRGRPKGSKKKPAANLNTASGKFSTNFVCYSCRSVAIRHRQNCSLSYSSAHFHFVTSFQVPAKMCQPMIQLLLWIPMKMWPAWVMGMLFIQSQFCLSVPFAGKKPKNLMKTGMVNQTNDWWRCREIQSDWIDPQYLTKWLR